MFIISQFPVRIVRELREPQELVATAVPGQRAGEVDEAEVVDGGLEPRYLDN